MPKKKGPATLAWDCPHQGDSLDCGVYLIYFADTLCRKKQVTVWEGANDMEMQRAYFASEILKDQRCKESAENCIENLITDAVDV